MVGSSVVILKVVNFVNIECFLIFGRNSDFVFVVILLPQLE